MATEHLQQASFLLENTILGNLGLNNEYYLYFYIALCFCFCIGLSADEYVNSPAAGRAFALRNKVC